MVCETTISTGHMNCAHREMCVALKLSLSPPFDIRALHGTFFETASWRINPTPADTSHSVNLFFASKLKQCCPSCTAPLWGNNRISISGTFEPLCQRQSRNFAVEKLWGRGRDCCIVVVFCAEAEFQSWECWDVLGNVLVSGYARI